MADSPVQDMIALLHEDWMSKEDKEYIKIWLREVIANMRDQKEEMHKYR